MKIILGSQSKGRKRILEEMGYQFEVMAANIDEKAIRSGNPYELTLLLARAKAEKILSKIKEPAVIIASDQVGLCNGKILEKPENEARIREYFGDYAKYPAETITAVVVVNTGTGKRAEGIDVAKVTFKLIPEKIIDEVIKKGEIFYCSGAFSIEDPLLKKYIEKIEGERESVMGLPRKLTEKLIKKVAENNL